MTRTLKGALARLTDGIRDADEGVSPAEMNALLEAIGEARGWQDESKAPAPGTDDDVNPEEIRDAVLKLFAELTESQAA